MPQMFSKQDRKSTRLNSSHTVIYTLSLHDALPIFGILGLARATRAGVTTLLSTLVGEALRANAADVLKARSEEHTSELQSHRDLHSFPTRRSSDLRHSRPGSCHTGRRYHPAEHTRRRGAARQCRRCSQSKIGRASCRERV